MKRRRRSRRPKTLSLVRSAQGGSTRAMERLFSRYLPRIRRIVALRTGRRLRALHGEEDLVQQALLRVFRSLKDFEPRSEASFRNWVARCVENEIVDLSRRAEAAKRNGGPIHLGGDCEAFLASIEDPRQATPSEIARAGELEERIERVLLQMPDHFREIIILRHLCGMSHREIAEELGFGSESSVRVALSRALDHLRRKLEP